MRKRHTSKPRRRSRTNVLQVRVMSPRIAWFSMLKLSAALIRISCILAVVAAIGWLGWRGVQRVFYDNPDFRLRLIELNPNPALDEEQLVAVAGIDLMQHPSIFDLDVADIAERLNALPPIAAAQVERRLPGTLAVQVSARSPRAWLACAEEHLPAVRQVGGLLVDLHGIAYPCPALQYESAMALPILHVPSDPGHPIAVGKTVRQPELRHCLRLLDAACEGDPDAIQWIESVRQVNAWSLELVTRQGTAATFGLGDHKRQIADFRAALEHAHQKQYAIATINLIPKQNIPITVANEQTPPRAIPVAEPTAGELREERRMRDLNRLLNRD